MRRVAFILIALVGASVMAALLSLAPARAAVSPVDEAALREAADLINRKRPAEALARLAPLRPTLTGEVDFNMVYGVALLDSARPRQAAFAFRRVLAVQPEHLLARAQLARALATSGELDEARREIMVVRERPDLPPDIREVMDRNLQRIDEARQQRTQAALAARAQATAAARPPAVPRLTARDEATIRQCADLVRDEKAPEAYAKLAPLEARLAGNPDYDYVYGVAALDSGYPAQAVVALRRAVKVRPDFHIARAELGRALAAMGDLAGAKREFEMVRSLPDLPPVARDALGRRITAIDEAALAAAAASAQTGPRINGYLESSAGYDTNVNAGPSNQTLIIPALAFLGPATISPAAMPKAAGFYELAGGLSMAYPLSNQVAVFSNLVGNFHPLFSDTQFRTATAGGEAGVAAQVDGLGIFSVAGVGQTFMIGGQFFRNVFGAAAQWRQSYANAFDTSVAFTWLRLEYPNLTGQDTNRFTVTGSIGRRFDAPLKPALTVSVNVGKELALTSGNDFLSFTLVGVRATFELVPVPWIVVFVQASYEFHQHDADYPLFLMHRQDQLFEVLGGVELKLSERLSVRPSVRWGQTFSNVDIFVSRRLIAQTALRWSF